LVHGGFGSWANAVPAKTIAKMIAKVSLFKVFMGVLLNFEVDFANLCAGKRIAGLFNGALNTSPKSLRQGFYHRRRKVGLT